ncbi:acetoacetate-CoA ligase [Morchella conica CCBAS932]|uniref:Acetoacetate-CoA ligase n=1 Tax=Morchella conica CCBAS932 TaxID=1392247 RepID=A0A3N4LD98_9PEZI|nr:acetoacetate-CoA ligase [Morchella conica CCBAS932]
MVLDTTAAAVLPVEAIPGRKLWEHPYPKITQMHRFKAYISSKYNVQFGPETDKDTSLWRWSVEHPSQFWGDVWDFTGIVASRRWDTVVDEAAGIYPRPAWFAGAKLNFAENLLFPRALRGSNEDHGKVAVVEVAEGEERVFVTWAQLKERVRACAAAMKGWVKVGDRVTGYVANHVDALVAMLAATSLGCVWSGISPDHGATAVLDRLVQLEPTILFADSAVLYNGKVHDVMHKLKLVVAALPTLKAVVVIDKFSQSPDIPGVKPINGDSYIYADFLSTAADKDAPLEFLQLDPDHPVFILFSSGTTGKPKCICHGAIGTLIQHKKEHILHCDMTYASTFFQFTTVTWMMWHWLVSALSFGATIVLYDGSPFHPHGSPSMPLLLRDLNVTHFGTSAKYLSLLEQHSVSPPPLPHLKAIYSTAAVLAPSTFEYVYRAFGPINLASITGGTDIISLFGAPSPLSPVHSGEIQCLGLGMNVQAWSPAGTQVPDGTAGDLVCVTPFPCMPVSFWGPAGEDLYKKSYFTQFPGVWHHGDFVKIVGETRGLVMLGRSDGILKPAGVRFGSAEIYNILLAHFPTQFDDALCIGRRRPTDTDEQVVLFVKLSAGQDLTPELVKEVRDRIRRELSARHVPAVVEACPEIPVTTNGKKVEVAVKQILCGMDVAVSASVANAGCLEWFREWAEVN